jgi:hypothetical protein
MDVNTSHTPAEGAHSSSWPNGAIIIIMHKHVTNKRRHVNYPRDDTNCQARKFFFTLGCVVAKDSLAHTAMAPSFNQ